MVKQRTRGRAGFSLVEAVVAMTICAIGLVGAAGALSYAAKISRVAQDTMVAEALASELLAQTRAQSFTSLQSWYTYPGETEVHGLEAEFAARLGETRLANPQAWLMVTDVQTDLKGVSVVIEWGTGHPRGRVETETLRSPSF